MPCSCSCHFPHLPRPRGTLALFRAGGNPFQIMQRKCDLSVGNPFALHGFAAPRPAASAARRCKELTQHVDEAVKSWRSSGFHEGGARLRMRAVSGCNTCPIGRNGANYRRS